jgi:hypothetical protein
MKKKIIGVFVCMLLIGVSTVAVADWDVGEPFKMHFPQLPDPDGFDVDWGHGALGDDWQCIETGNVDDIHFWISWFTDDPMDIPFIDVSIWSNNPQGPGGWSEPLDMLWQRTFQQGQFVMRHYGDGNQLWMMPWGEIIPQPHFGIYQINIKEIDDPFEQIEGEIYWLVIGMPWTTEWTIGWKTSTDWFMDHPVWQDPAGMWIMIDGIEFAFVITGEPPPPPVPNLDCDGDLTWTGVPGGSTVTDTFNVSNIGDPLSELDWDITEWPTWGSWSFNPSSGNALKPEDGPVSVQVTVVTPQGIPRIILPPRDTTFTGQVKVINLDDPSDFCIIDVSLTVPKNKAFNINMLFLRFLENHPHMFPVIRHMLGL